ncbi:hypothetical protein C8Q80DRAFT_1193447 [Daedaleopsis nitida]|nr:hypothetical protein C8Q80DRAFT_1193447 [Daedaleopsis nitida]
MRRTRMRSVAAVAQLEFEEYPGAIPTWLELVGGVDRATRMRYDAGTHWGVECHSVDFH